MTIAPLTLSSVSVSVAPQFNGADGSMYINLIFTVPASTAGQPAVQIGSQSNFIDATSAKAAMNQAASAAESAFNLSPIDLMTVRGLLLLKGANRLPEAVFGLIPASLLTAAS